MTTRAVKVFALNCLKLLVCLQLIMSGVVASATSSKVDLRAFLCSPSGQTLSIEAENALSEIAALLGEVPQDDPIIEDHCELCTLSHIALPSPQYLGISAQYELPKDKHTIFQSGLFHKAQGPPRGSRAPPLSI